MQKRDVHHDFVYYFFFLFWSRTTIQDRPNLKRHLRGNIIQGKTDNQELVIDFRTKRYNTDATIVCVCTQISVKLQCITMVRGWLCLFRDNVNVILSKCKMQSVDSNHVIKKEHQTTAWMDGGRYFVITINYAVLSKNAVSANINNSRYFCYASHFWWIHYCGKRLYVHMFHIVDTAFSYWREFIVC